MSSDPATTAHDPPLAPGRRQRLAARAHAWRLLPALQTVRGLFRRDLRVLAYHRVTSATTCAFSSSTSAYLAGLGIASCAGQWKRRKRKTGGEGKRGL